MRWFVVFFALFLFNCKEKKKDLSLFEKVIVDENLANNDTIKLLSKFPELKLYDKEKVESKTRTAYIVQNSGHGKFWLTFDNYKCKAEKKADTLEISLNNYDGMISNGILIKVFENHFFVKNYNPKTLKGEVKFFNTKAENEILKLNKTEFQKNDSIYGFIDYECVIGDGELTKNMGGYFKTKVQ